MSSSHRWWAVALGLAAAATFVFTVATPSPEPAPPPLPWPSVASLELEAEGSLTALLTPVPSSAEAVSADDTKAPPEPPRRQVVVASRQRPATIWPLSGRITSGFGPRWGRFHQGIDIAAPVGTIVRAAAAGEVTATGWRSGYGYTVTIEHGGGTRTFYAHLSRTLVHAGAAVEKGEPIGKVGETGHATGPHLHLEVHIDGDPVDPMSVLPTR